MAVLVHEKPTLTPALSSEPIGFVGQVEAFLVGAGPLGKPGRWDAGAPGGDDLVAMMS